MKAGSILILLAGIILGLPACSPSTDSGEVPELSEAERTTYLEQGKSIAAATFAVLSSRLQTAMGEGGVPEAVNYCQLNAYRLVDSLSKVHRASIRRTSLLARNPADRPTELEREILETYAGQDTDGQELQPMVRALENQEVAFFAPIRTNTFCLNCHGIPGETIQEKDYALIRRHYPEDNAIGYQDGDLRGMWSIRLRRQE